MFRRIPKSKAILLPEFLITSKRLLACDRQSLTSRHLSGGVAVLVRVTKSHRTTLKNH